MSLPSSEKKTTSGSLTVKMRPKVSKRHQAQADSCPACLVLPLEEHEQQPKLAGLLCTPPEKIA